jgi:hypothetical protein
MMFNNFPGHGGREQDAAQGRPLRHRHEQVGATVVPLRSRTRGLEVSTAPLGEDLADTSATSGTGWGARHANVR